MRSISVAEQGRLRSNMRPSAPARQIPVETGICQLNPSLRTGEIRFAGEITS